MLMAFFADFEMDSASCEFHIFITFFAAYAWWQLILIEENRNKNKIIDINTVNQSGAYHISTQYLLLGDYDHGGGLSGGPWYIYIYSLNKSYLDFVLCVSVA